MLRCACATGMFCKRHGCADYILVAISGWLWSVWANLDSCTRSGQKPTTLFTWLTITKLQNYASCFCRLSWTKITWGKSVAFAERAMAWHTWRRGREDTSWSASFNGERWKNESWGFWQRGAHANQTKGHEPNSRCDHGNVIFIFCKCTVHVFSHSLPWMGLWPLTCEISRPRPRMLHLFFQLPYTA